MVFGAEEGCARQWEERWDNRNRHTHLYTNTPSQAPKRKEGMHAVSHSACVTIYRLFLFSPPFLSLCTPTRTQISGIGGDDPPPTTQLNLASGLPAPAQCILVGWVSLGGWQLGIEGSFWVDWLTDCPDCSVARPPFPAVSVGSPARERGFFFGWVGLWCVGLQRLASSHSHTHARTHALTYVFVLLAYSRPNKWVVDGRPRCGTSQIWVLGLLEWAIRWWACLRYSTQPHWGTPRLP